VKIPETNKMAERADDHIIRVSSGKPHFVFVNAAKQLFTRHQAIELHGVSFAINNAVKAAEMLSSLGYANIVGIETQPMPMSESGRPNAKIVVKLAKANSFDKAVEDYNARVQSRS
jgi:hypothetical protein